MSARILVVDDVSHNLELITYLLRAAGHEVLGAASGAEALAAARDHRPDLIVLDLQLPDMDGYQVLRRLRSEPSHACMPVIAVTAYAMVGDRDAALSAGFDGYLSKPVDPMRLAESIESHLPAHLVADDYAGRHRGVTA